MYTINTKALVELRKNKGLSQEKMGAQLHMDGSNYGKLERGEAELTLRMVFKIAEILHVKFEDYINMPTIISYTKSEDEAVVLIERAVHLLKLRFNN